MPWAGGVFWLREAKVRESCAPQPVVQASPHVTSIFSPDFAVLGPVRPGSPVGGSRLNWGRFRRLYAGRTSKVGGTAHTLEKVLHWLSAFHAFDP